MCLDLEQIATEFFLRQQTCNMNDHKQHSQNIEKCTQGKNDKFGPLLKNLNPESWGWRRVEEHFEARTTDLPPAPEKLLKGVRYSCKRGMFLQETWSSMLIWM